MKISEKDINYLKHSLIDNIGRVFQYEGKIYRGIYPEQERHVRHLFDCHLIPELIDNQLFPKTYITDISTEQFNLVLQHEMLFVSYPNEWTFDMLRDAALVTLKVNAIALKYGFQLKDAHGFNILFKNNQPYFIDIGSFIQKSERDFLPAHEFLQAFCLPLVLMAKGKSYLAYKFLNDPYFPYSKLLVDAMPYDLYKEVCYFYQLVLRFSNFPIHFSLNKWTFNFAQFFLKVCLKLGINKKLVKIELSKNTSNLLKHLKYKQNSLWADYHKDYFKGDDIQTTERFNYILKAVKSLNQATSALDVAANQGLLPVLLHKEISFEKIIHLDYDVNACNEAYLFYAKNNLPIDIICTNFLELMNDKALCDKLKSDIVFALALTHHLILSQGISLPALLNTFSHLTHQYIVIEFMPLGLWDGKNAPPIPDWYNINWFRVHFEKYFMLIEENTIETNRIVFICKKK